MFDLQRTRTRFGNAARKAVTRVVELRMVHQVDEDAQVMFGRDVVRSARTRFGGLNLVGEGTVLEGDVEIGFASTLSRHCYLSGPLTVGRYCQFGPHVACHATDHPTRRVTMYTNSRLFDGRLSRGVEPQEITVGHSAWIAHGAIVLKGVSIGNGAVIGAGSVVTTDVPPYAVAVGSPARVISMRFDAGVAAAIEASRWWSMTPAELEPFEAVFHLDAVEDRDEILDLLGRIACQMEPASDARASVERH